MTQLDLLSDLCVRSLNNPHSLAADHHGHKASDRVTVLALIRQQGSYGATLDELSACLNRPPNALSGRLCELRACEPPAIRCTEATRPTRTGAKARVYVACQQDAR